MDFTDRVSDLIAQIRQKEVKEQRIEMNIKFTHERIEEDAGRVLNKLARKVPAKDYSRLKDGIKFFIGKHAIIINFSDVLEAYTNEVGIPPGEDMYETLKNENFVPILEQQIELQLRNYL